MRKEHFRPDAVVVHYHEIALKGDNRPLFVNRLIDNIGESCRDLGIERVDSPRGRIILRLSEDSSWDEILKRLRKVFGIANFSPAVRSASGLASLKNTVSELIAGREFSSFRISARRANKGYPLTSVELNEKLGRHVQDLTGARVDLKSPDLAVYVEVLKKETLVYIDRHRGGGGLPVGVGGTVACLLSGGIDSPVAAHMMMKRGCRVVFIHFHGHPFLTKASLEKAEDLSKHLTPYQIRSRLYAVPFGDIQREIVLTVPPPLRVVLYRRFMLRIAEELAGREGAKALVTGESLGQVASQTLDNIAAISEAANLPILRPLIGWDKQEIIESAIAIGTYPISILPDQDCCRLFIPPHPSVGARPEDVRRAEGRLDIHGLVKKGVEAVEGFNFGPTSPF